MLGSMLKEGNLSRVVRLLKPVNEMPGSDSGEVVFYCARRIQTCKSRKKKQGWLMLKPNGSLEYLLYCI